MSEQGSQNNAATNQETVQPEATATEVKPAKVKTVGLRKSKPLIAETPNVLADVANLNPSISRLIGDEDTMELHTREAMLLFAGKDKDKERAYLLPGARHAAGALRQMFVLTAMDNPYADYVLVQVDDQAHKIKQLIATLRARRIKQLDALASIGLSYSIARAQTTQKVSLGYHSPYGYMMSTLIVMFDECVRVMKSAERRDLMTRSELHDDLYAIKHQMRSMFDSILRAQRVLGGDAMRGLQRSDFGPEVTNPLAIKRIESARQVLGVIPEEVFAGKLQPRHSMSKERLSAKDQQALEALARVVSQPVAQESLGDTSGAALVD